MSIESDDGAFAARHHDISRNRSVRRKEFACHGPMVALRPRPLAATSAAQLQQASKICFGDDESGNLDALVLQWNLVGSFRGPGPCAHRHSQPPAAALASPASGVQATAATPNHSPQSPARLSLMARASLGRFYLFLFPAAWFLWTLISLIIIGYSSCSSPRYPVAAHLPGLDVCPSVARGSIRCAI